MYQPIDSLRSPRPDLPTMYDLPSEDPEESGLPDEFHLYQPRLLSETFCPPAYPVEQVFTAADLNVYYDLAHTMWHKRPDWFGVVGGSRFYGQQRDLRMSYVMWQEGVSPTVVVELLSPGTEDEDFGTALRDAAKPPSKWEVYERILQIPYYVIFDRYTDTLRVFQRQSSRLVAITDLPESRFWMPELSLGIGVWQGTYAGVERPWLRWFAQSGDWIPTPQERDAVLLEQAHRQTEQERLRAEQESLRAEQERRKVEQLMAQLRSLGIEPDLEL